MAQGTAFYISHLPPLSMLGSSLTTKYTIRKHPVPFVKPSRERKMCFFPFLSRNFSPALHSSKVVDGLLQSSIDVAEVTSLATADCH